MILDLTTKISRELMEELLKKNGQSHVAAGHIGTHLDTYGKTSIPLDYFKSPGVLIDVTDFCGEREITRTDAEHADIQPGSFVLFRTGRLERFPYGSEAYFENHPQLSHELIGWLIEKKVHFIGIDCAGVRRGTEHKPADIRCEEGGVYVIENLCGLDKIGTGECTVYTMWLDDIEMTGLKCRVLADVK